MKILANQNGFTYILALTVIMIMGIMLGMSGQSWKALKQRELEEELIFRGDQVAEVVFQKLVYKNHNLSPASVGSFLWPINSPQGTILDDLVNVKTETFAGKPPKNFRLRPSAIIDPMTNRQWKIESPVGNVDRFAGVRSESTDVPFRKSFKSIYDSGLDDVEDKKKYSDWKFTWKLKSPVK